MDLVVQIYQITNSFPKEEMYSLTSQIRRAATSIPANIAEGWGQTFSTGAEKISDNIQRFSDGIGNSSNRSSQTENVREGNYDSNMENTSANSENANSNDKKHNLEINEEKTNSQFLISNSDYSKYALPEQIAKIKICDPACG